MATSKDKTTQTTVVKSATNSNQLHSAAGQALMTMIGALTIPTLTSLSIAEHVKIQTSKSFH